MTEDPSFWRTGSLIAAAVGQTCFILLYVLWPWWNNFLGRALFFKTLAITLILDIGLLFRVIEWRYEDLVFTILYGLFALGVWVQFAAFLRVRLRKGAPGDRNPK